MAHTLYSDEISHVSLATERFSSEKGLVLLRPHRPCCHSLHFTIPSGCYALVSRHGADEEYVTSDGRRSIVWPAGLHFPHPPWVHVSNLVTQQAIVLDLPVKACKTKDNVTVNIDVTLAFRIMGNAELGEDPDLVRIFVHELKPRGLEQQLRDAQDEAVRGLARSLKHTEIYGIRSGENTKLIQESVVGGNSGVGGGNGGSVMTPSPISPLVGEKIIDEKEEEEKMEIGGEEDTPKEEEKEELKMVLSADEDDDGENVVDPTLPGLPTHRDETLVGTSDQEDRKAAKLATAAGVDVTDYMKKKLNRQFMPQGVEILSIMITSCTLPTEIESQMEEKTKVISKNAQQRMFHQNNMQNTRMEEEVQTLKQSFEEQRLQEESAGAERINEERVKLNDEMAAAKKAEVAIREEAAANIQKLLAENRLEVQRITSRKEEIIATMKAQAEKEAAELLARTKLDVEKKLADASLTAAKNRAEASRVMAKAEGIIAPYLAKKNEHITNMKQIDVYRNLANNENLVLCGADDDDLNAVVVADSILSDSRNREYFSPSSVMAELSLMQKGSSGIFANQPRTVTTLVHEP